MTRPRYPEYKIGRRKLLQLTGGLIAGPAILAACGPVTPPGAVASAAPGTAARASRSDLVVALPGEPGFLNPVMVTGDRNFSKVSWQVFDSLLAYDYDKGELVPQLATSWRQKDATTWEFTLRQGVQFHRGYGEMTAADVEFMVNYVVGKNKPLKFLYFFVDGAKATGKYTVEYKLSKAFAPFLITTVRDRGAMIVSKKAYDELGEEAFNRKPVGTGPFEVVDWKAGSEISLKRHDKYWQSGVTQLDKITYRIIGDTVTRESLLKTGEVDLIDAPNYKNVATWRKDEGYVVTSTPNWGTDWLPFSVTTPPFDKKELRQAVSFALDREAIARDLYFGEAQADQGPLPKGYIGYPSPQVYPLAGDKRRAKELLAKAGSPSGFKTTALTTAPFKPLAEVVSGQLADVGIQVAIDVVDGGTYNARTNSRKFEMAVVNLGFMTPDTDSTVYWFYHTNTVGNYGYDNPTVDRMLDEARTLGDRDQRAQMYKSILGTALDDAPYAYLLHPNIVRIHKKGLAGVATYPQDHVMIFRDAKWEK